MSFDALQEIDFVQDESVNFNSDAFGLGDFEAIPVFQSRTKEEIKTEIAQQQKEKNTPMTVDKKAVHKDDEKPERHLGWLWILLSVLTVAAALFLLNYFRIIKIDFDKWFGNEESVVVVPDTIVPVEKPILADTIVNDTLSVMDSIVNESVDISIDTLSIIDGQQELPEENVVVETPSEDAKFFIVGGCFSTEDNANKLAVSLKDRGFEAAFVKQRGKLWDVYYGKYDPAGIVHKGEVVFSQADIARLGGVGVVEAMRKGQKGYSDGGVVGSPKLVGFKQTSPQNTDEKISIEVNVTDSGVSTQSSNGEKKLLGDMIGNAVRAVIRQEKRQGGLLY